MSELVILGVLALLGHSFWRIARKAGWSGPVSLLMFVPLANLVLIVAFANTEWPVEKKLRDAGLGDL